MNPSDIRVSNVVYVLVRVPTAQGPALLLRHHAKWGDWSLVGGHVEEDEMDDWHHAAAREATEELEPLVNERHFVVEIGPVTNRRFRLGPKPSRSAQGKQTVYNIEYYILKFLKDPAELLRLLPQSEFRLIPEHKLESMADAYGPPVRVAQELLHDHPDAVPSSWDKVLDTSALGPMMQASGGALGQDH